LIQDEVEDQLSEKLLRGKFSAGEIIELDVKDGTIVVQTPKKKRGTRRSKAKDVDDKEPVAQ
jgi:ATP-dependent Clp protease ATP-binding subunit ClpA